VDLPQPEGPTSTANSPSAMPMSTPRITCVPPKCFWTLRIWTEAMARSWIPDLVSAFHDNVLRPSMLGPIDEVLRGLRAQLPFALHGIERGVRREEHPRMLEQRIIRHRRLLGKHVEGGAVEAPGIERREQVGHVHDATPRGIHEPGSLLHEREEPAIDH